MLKLVIEAEDGKHLREILANIVGFGIREYLHGASSPAPDARSTDAVPGESKPPGDQQQPPEQKRRGRPPKAETVVLPPPTREDVIKALEKYSDRNGGDDNGGPLASKKVMAQVCGADRLIDIDPGNYRKLIDALAV